MIQVLLRILALARKELLAVLKDPRGRVTLIVPPIISCVVFGYAATFDLSHVGYAVVDHDHSRASASLLARLDGSGVFERVADAQSLEGAAKLVDGRRALLIIQIADGFERRLQAGEPAPLQVIADGRNSNTAATALSYVSAVAGAFGEDWRRDADPNATDGGASRASAGPAVQVTTRAWYNPNLASRWLIVPSLIATLSLLDLTVTTAMAVAREREQGTLDQLLVTPFGPIEIMAGKALPSVLIGFVQATVVLLVAQLWFRIPFAGSYPVLYACLTLFLVASIGVGLMISMLAANMQQAILFSFMVLMPMILLSGLFTPVSTMPAALRDLDAVNPLRYALDITQRIYLEGAGLPALTSDLVPLAVIAAASLAASAWLFRNRLT
jgi:ABC-2 type transport system permease protein